MKSEGGKQTGRRVSQGCSNTLSLMAATASVSSHPRSLAELDRSVSLYLYRHVGSKLPRSIFMLLEHSGNGVAWLLLVPALWFSTVLDASTRSYVANFFIGLWVDLALVGTLKGLVRRPRPVYNYSGDFRLVVSVDKYSFPSGHAARYIVLPTPRRTFLLF